MLTCWLIHSNLPLQASQVVQVCMQASGATRERRCKQQLAGSKTAFSKWVRVYTKHAKRLTDLVRSACKAHLNCLQSYFDWQVLVCCKLKTARCISSACSASTNSHHLRAKCHLQPPSLLAYLLLSCLLQQSAGFPEIEADTFLDWNSQAAGEAPADHALSPGDPPSDTKAVSHSNTQDYVQEQQCAGSLIWESAGLAPRLKLPVLVNPAHSSSNGVGVLSLPPDMPTGPSIATARVKHPLSSTESAALTQLRAELSALFAEANRGPDLSLVPLPRQLNQATAPAAGTDSTAVKVARPTRLQPRAAAAMLRSTSRRRYTADAAVPNAMRTRHSMSAEKPQAMTELSQQGVTHPAMTQHPQSHQAVIRAADSGGAAARAYAPSGATTQDAAPPSSKSKKYGRSNSWAAGSSPTRTGLTQNGPTSTSYSK